MNIYLRLIIFTSAALQLGGLSFAAAQTCAQWNRMARHDRLSLFDEYWRGAKGDEAFPEFQLQSIVRAKTVERMEEICKRPENANSLLLSDNRSSGVFVDAAKRTITEVLQLHQRKADVLPLGMPAEVGAFQYEVRDSYWKRNVSHRTFGFVAADGLFLFVEVTVSNQDRQQRAIPQFKLRDLRGAEYGSTNKLWFVDNVFKPLENLNPGVSKTVVVVFDVPRQNYRLEVSGGFGTGGSVLMELSPREGMQE